MSESTLRKERKGKERRRKETNWTGRTAILWSVPSCEDIVFLFFLLENVRMVPKKRVPFKNHTKFQPSGIHQEWSNVGSGCLSWSFHESTSKLCPYIWDHHVKDFLSMDGKGCFAIPGTWSVWRYCLYWVPFRDWTLPRLSRLLFQSFIMDLGTVFLDEDFKVAN